MQQIKTIEKDLGININEAIADRAYGSGDIIQALIDKAINTVSVSGLRICVFKSIKMQIRKPDIIFINCKRFGKHIFLI